MILAITATILLIIIIITRIVSTYIQKSTHKELAPKTIINYSIYIFCIIIIIYKIISIIIITNIIALTTIKVELVVVIISSCNYSQKYHTFFPVKL